MAYDITLEGKNNIEALQLLENVSKILQKNNLDYWLDGGTLLGIVRENRLRPWDDDVDLSMFDPGERSLSKLIKSIKKAGLRVRVKLIKSSDEFFQENDIRVLKIRNKKVFGLIKGKVCLEIFIRKKIGENTYCRIGKTTQIIPYKYCFPLKTIAFQGHDYLAPELTNKYLTCKYGDWQTPVKEWCVFSDDKSMA
jgi:lipopolysaccharide cholinephosphotransferase